MRKERIPTGYHSADGFDDDGRTVEAIGLAEQLDERLNESEMVNALGSNFQQYLL